MRLLAWNRLAFDNIAQRVPKLGIAQTLQRKVKQLQHAIPDCLACKFEREPLAFIARRRGGGIGVAPVDPYGAARPERTWLGGRTVAHRDDDTHVRRAV